jgi:hypothetical protein
MEDSAEVLEKERAMLRAGARTKQARALPPANFREKSANLRDAALK